MEELIKIEAWVLTDTDDMDRTIGKVMERLNRADVYVDNFTVWNLKSWKPRGKKQLKALRTLRARHASK